MNQNSIDIKNKQLCIIQDIQKKQLPENATAWVFGSRATFTTKKSSYLDLAIELKDKAIPLSLLAQLNESFDESSLPFKVDIVDLNNVSSNFKKLIDKNKKFLPFSSL